MTWILWIQAGKAAINQELEKALVRRLTAWLVESPGMPVLGLSYWPNSAPSETSSPLPRRRHIPGNPQLRGGARTVARIRAVIYTYRCKYRPKNGHTERGSTRTSTHPGGGSVGPWTVSYRKAARSGSDHARILRAKYEQDLRPQSVSRGCHTTRHKTPDKRATHRFPGTGIGSPR